MVRDAVQRAKAREREMCVSRQPSRPDERHLLYRTVRGRTDDTGQEAPRPGSQSLLCRQAGRFGCPDNGITVPVQSHVFVSGKRGEFAVAGALILNTSSYVNDITNLVNESLLSTL